MLKNIKAYKIKRLQWWGMSGCPQISMFLYSWPCLSLPIGVKLRKSTTTKDKQANSRSGLGWITTP